MTEEEFSKIFISPLYENNVSLNEIDQNIYDEIIDLTNRFCIPSQILTNLIYDDEFKNPLIENLIEQIRISNLKKLINKKELFKIAKLFNDNSIDYAFMKGSAIDTLGDEYVRYSRDLDILVSKDSLSAAYELLKEIGYRYLNPYVSDSVEFTSQTHQLPIMSNREGSLVEIHHRVTKKLTYKECPLADLMLRQPAIINKEDVNIKISKTNHTIAHLTYHAFKHHELDLGPVFLYDIKYLRNLSKDEDELTDLLHKMDLIDDYRKVINFIDKEIVIDNFKIYKKQKNKIFLEKNPKKFRYLLFTNKGRIDLWNIFKGKLRYNEDYFQTSKYSLKFYFILLQALKIHIVKLLKK